MTNVKIGLRHDCYTVTFFNSHIAVLSTAVVPGRLELPTSTLSVWRSNQLSYRTLLGQRGDSAQPHHFSI